MKFNKLNFKDDWTIEKAQTLLDYENRIDIINPAPCSIFYQMSKNMDPSSNWRYGIGIILWAALLI